MRITEMSGYWHPVINEANHRCRSVRRQGEVELDCVHTSGKQGADLLRHRFRRGDAIQHFGEGGIVEALIRAIEQWTADEQPWPELFPAVQVGFDLLHLLQLAADIPRAGDTSSQEQRQTFVAHQRSMYVGVDQAGDNSLAF